MINHAPLYTKKKLNNKFFMGFWAEKTAIFLYKSKKMQRSDVWHQGRSSVAGVAGVAAATGIVEATLGAAVKNHCLRKKTFIFMLRGFSRGQSHFRSTWSQN
jgi:hypothetical protein